jgi:hypothetical protein
MSHYFDDILSRGIPLGSPKAEKPRMRRSSTARSIGARSDFDGSVNGDDQLDARSIVASDDAELREANAHLHQYITDQLERVQSKEEPDGFVDDHEYEAKA